MEKRWLCRPSSTENLSRESWSKIETNLIAAAVRSRSNDTGTSFLPLRFSRSVTPPPREAATMPCSAINYNVMVSLDICVQFANPTWPNLRVLIAARVCAPRRFVKKRVAEAEERERERERQGKKRDCSASTYLSSAGGQQCERVPHATVPLHPLSSNVSLSSFQRGQQTARADTDAIFIKM